MHDIVCCVTGPAVRPCVVAVKKVGNAVPSHLVQFCGDPRRPSQTSRLLTIRLPAGIYVMRGRQFQQHYTHEIPQIHERLFAKLVARGPELWPAPGGASVQKTELPRAFAAFTVRRKRDAEADNDDLTSAAKKAKPDDIPQLVFPVDVAPGEGGAPRTALVQADWLKQHRVEVRGAIVRGALRAPAQAQEDAAAFDEWCLHRTSYTFRCFREDAVDAMK